MENNNQNNADEKVLDAKKTKESPGGKPVRNEDTVDIPRIDAENLAELYTMATEYVQATKLGVFQAYHWPFEIQIERDFKALYGRLSSLFGAADKARLGVYKGALKMRIITYIGLIPFLAAFGFALDFVAPDNQSTGIDISKFSPDGDMNSVIVMFVFPVIAMFVIALIIHIFRTSQINGLMQQASIFGGVFNENLTILHGKADFAVDNVINDEATALGCDTRAEQWSFVAMWLFQLHQYYDRYVTTQSWRAQTRLHITSWVFRAAKVVTPFVFFGFLYVRTDWFFSNILLTLIAVVGALGLPYLAWDLFGKPGKSNNLWAECFVNGIAGKSEEEILKNHMNTKIATLIGGIRELQHQAAPKP